MRKIVAALAALLLAVWISGCSSATSFTGTVNCQPTVGNVTKCSFTQAPVAAPTPSVPAPSSPPSVTKTATPTPTATVTPTVTATPTPDVTAAGYPVHTNIVSTSFWVGEIFNASLSDGSQVCSTYDSKWAAHWSGKTLGNNTSSQPDCPGSPWGGCDGVATGSTAANFHCATEKRTAANGYQPSSGLPKENAFYLDLPFDDVNDATAFKQRCQVIPWAAAVNAADGVNHCADPGYSYMKNRWVKITGPNGATCYGQIEDAGPSSGSAYHDSSYVFGSTNARPLNKQFSGDPSQGAGMDVSPALNGCLGFKDLDGDNDHVSWAFVDAPPPGPWTTVVTTSGVTP